MKLNTALRLFECTKCGHETFHKTIKRKINKTWNIYNAMKNRCLNKTAAPYKNYGGRGIKICSRWLESFDNFYADMSEPPTDKHTLDRIDNNGDYAPENCRWATRGEQNNNTRQVRYFKHEGLRLTTRQWSEKTDISKTCIDERIKLGWSLKKIFSCPSFKGRNQFGTDGVQYTFNNETMGLKKWAIKIGISYETLYKRIHKYKWSLEKTLNEPVKRKPK